MYYIAPPTEVDGTTIVSTNGVLSVATTFRAFVELWSALHTPAARGSWEQWDLTASVPAGAVAVVIRAENLTTSDGNTTQFDGARALGSAVARSSPYMAGRGTVDFLVDVRDSRIIEIYGRPTSDGTDVRFRVAGYIA